MGGGAPPAGPGAPPPTGLEDILGGDNLAPQEGEPPRDSGKKSFKAASKNASERLKKRNSKK